MAVFRSNSVKDRFKDRAYMNWQRACQSLVILKESLDDFIEDQATELHRYMRAWSGGWELPVCQENHDASDIRRIGFGRDMRWGMRPECAACEWWIDHILRLHENTHNIHWSNCNIQDWPGSSWQVAKAFMNKLPAKDRRNRACDFDVNPMLHLLANCRFFHKGAGEWGFRIGLQSFVVVVVQKLIDNRNILFHHKSLEVDTEFVDETIERLRKLLNGLKRSYQLNVRGVKDKLTELKNLDPMYLDRPEWDVMKRREAIVTAMFLDEVEAMMDNDSFDDIPEEKVDKMFKMLDQKENEDLRGGVNVLRDIENLRQRWKDLGKGKEKSRFPCIPWIRSLMDRCDPSRKYRYQQLEDGDENEPLCWPPWNVFRVCCKRPNGANPSRMCVCCDMVYARCATCLLFGHDLHGQSTDCICPAWLLQAMSRCCKMDPEPLPERSDRNPPQATVIQPARLTLTLTETSQDLPLLSIVKQYLSRALSDLCCVEACREKLASITTENTAISTQPEPSVGRTDRSPAHSQLLNSAVTAQPAPREVVPLERIPTLSSRETTTL